MNIQEIQNKVFKQPLSEAKQKALFKARKSLALRRKMRAAKREQERIEAQKFKKANNMLMKIFPDGVPMRFINSFKTNDDNDESDNESDYGPIIEVVKSNNDDIEPSRVIHVNLHKKKKKVKEEINHSSTFPTSIPCGYFSDSKIITHHTDIFGRPVSRHYFQIVKL